MPIITVMETIFFLFENEKWKSAFTVYTLNCYNYRSGQFNDMFAPSKQNIQEIRTCLCWLYQQIVALRCTFFLLLFISFVFPWCDTSPTSCGSIALRDIRYSSVDVLDWLCRKQHKGLLRKCQGKTALQIAI